MTSGIWQTIYHFLIRVIDDNEYIFRPLFIGHFYFLKNCNNSILVYWGIRFPETINNQTVKIITTAFVDIAPYIFLKLKVFQEWKKDHYPLVFLFLLHSLWLIIYDIRIRELYIVYLSGYRRLLIIWFTLLGNMWAQDWLTLLDICTPYPGKPTVDSTPVLKREVPHLII